jgi:hypothetical protein
MAVRWGLLALPPFVCFGGLPVFDRKLYPKEWRPDRRKKLKGAGGRCEECGAAHRSIKKSRAGENYMVYLSIAHKNQYETWKRDAETMTLCQTCHRRFDRQFRRKGKAQTYTPISVISLLVVENDQYLLVGDARTYDHLRDMVKALPLGAVFLVECSMHRVLVGCGQYVKQADGKVEVIAEDGAAVGLVVELQPMVSMIGASNQWIQVPKYRRKHS